MPFRYVNLYDAAVSAVETYRAEVMAGSFPQACNSSFMKPAESEKLLARCSGRAVTRDTLKVFPSGNGITSSHPHGTTMEGSVPVGTSSDCAEPVQAGPYKVCVFGGGRMGQLFAWIFAGSPCFASDNRDSAVWQHTQKRSTEVTICTSREDLIAASVKAKGLLSVVQSTSSPRSDDADNGAKRSFMLTNETVRTGCHPKGAEERRPVDVVSRKAMETLGRTFDLVIIACLSGDTQDIGTSDDLLLDAQISTRTFCC